MTEGEFDRDPVRDAVALAKALLRDDEEGADAILAACSPGRTAVSMGFLVVDLLAHLSYDEAVARIDRSITAELR